MKERPILMSAPMVRAILAGTKTETRRGIKPAPPDDIDEISQMPAVDPVTGFMVSGDSGRWEDAHGCDLRWNCPYGIPGDRLWVREQWSAAVCFDKTNPAALPDDAAIRFLADGATNGFPLPMPGRLRPSIFMRRWMARIVLEVADVRVERLQAISAADAIAEGLESKHYAASGRTVFANYDDADDFTIGFSSPVDSYRSLWESINGAGSWAKNPWVWVVKFRRVEA